MAVSRGGLYVLTPTITEENSYWYRGTADAIYQNLDFLRKSHEPYVIISSGDCVYKLDYNKLLDHHIESKADITVVCKKLDKGVDDVNRFGVVKMEADNRIVSFEEKPFVTDSNLISSGVYVIRRRLLIELIEKANAEQRYDFVRDILIRYKDIKIMKGYVMRGYWSNIATLDAYFRTNMDFLKKDVRDHFFKDYPNVYSKIDDLPRQNLIRDPR